MNRNSHKNLTSPIIGRCTLLAENILTFTAQANNSIKHPFVDELKKDSALLFKYALRQLNGKDYYKRTIELIEEMQSFIYLILALGGIKKLDAMKLDVELDAILEQLNSIRFGQNVKTNG